MTIVRNAVYLSPAIEPACFLILLALAGCSESTSDGSHEQEHATIYATVLNDALPEHLPEKGNQRRQLVVEETTRMEFHFLIERLVTTDDDAWNAASKTIRKLLPDLSPDTLADFKRQNLEPGKVVPRLDLTVPYIAPLRDGVGPKAVSSTTNTETLGVASLSGIGFSSSGSEALVHCSILTSVKSGTGYLMLLKKNNGKWTIKSKAIAWHA